MGQVYAFFVSGPRPQSSNPNSQGVTLRVPVHFNSNLFYAPTLVQQNRLQAGIFANEQIFYGPTVTTGTAIVVPLVANGQTFYAPQLDLALVAPLLDNGQAFFAPIVSLANGLAASLFTNSQTFYGPSVGLSLTASKLTNSQTFHSPLITLGPSPGQTLSTPTVSLTSSDGEPPAVDLGMGADIYAGYYLRIQRSANGTKNASDGSYANATLNITHLVTPPEVAALAITNADLAPDGYIDPTGTWYQQYRWEREDGALSAWSTEITGTVTVSTAGWYASTGTNKSQYVTVSGFTAQCSANVGSLCGVRATVEMANDKAHAELAVGDLCDSSGRITFGVTNATQNLQVTTSIPGSGSAPGCALQIAYNSTSATIGRNGGTQAVSLPAAPAAGDIISVDLDRTTNQVTFKFYRLATTSTTTLATITMTSNIPADWYLFSGYNKRLSSTNLDQGTTNFGADAFTVTPLSGHTIYG